MNLQPHSESLPELPQEVVVLVAVFQFLKVLLLVERDARDFQCVGARPGLPLGGVQVAEPVPLVDAEDAVVVAMGDDVADMVVEGLDGGHEL